MTKTKRQLRAEAVKRLEGMDLSALDIMRGFAKAVEGEENFEDSVLLFRKTLIDLLTDDDAPVMDDANADKIPEVIDKDWARNLIEQFGRESLGCRYQFDDDAYARIAEYISDMIERDYVRRDSLIDDEPSKGDALQRLEWVVYEMRNIGASTLTPRELFSYWASEVEKARDMVERDYVRRDSLADDEPPEQCNHEWRRGDPYYTWTCEKCGETRKAVNEPESEQDTREKLEEDIKSRFNPPAEPDGEYAVMSCDPATVFGWLDRQAAITERECQKGSENAATTRVEFDIPLYGWHEGDRCDTAAWKANYMHMKKQRDELQEKVDALEAELNRACTLAYDGKWLTCSECGESLQWFGVRTVYKAGTQERALGVDGVRFCPFCGARIEGGESE